MGEFFFEKFAELFFGAVAKFGEAECAADRFPLFCFEGIAAGVFLGKFSCKQVIGACGGSIFQRMVERARESFSCVVERPAILQVPVEGRLVGLQRMDCEAGLAKERFFYERQRSVEQMGVERSEKKGRAGGPSF